MKIENEPYEELINELLAEILKHKKVFEAAYDCRSPLNHPRWHQTKEGLFIDQLDLLSHRVSNNEFPVDSIGEYVMAFFNAQDDGIL